MHLSSKRNSKHHFKEIASTSKNSFHSNVDTSKNNRKNISNFQEKKLSKHDSDKLYTHELSASYKNTNIEEDQAESVDSGCVPDLVSDPTSWSRVRLALNYEYNFALRLLQQTPFYVSQVNEPLLGEEEPQLSSNDENEKLGLVEENSHIKPNQPHKKPNKTLNSQEKRKKFRMKIRRDNKAIETQASSSTTLEQSRKIYNQCGKLVFSKFDFSNATKERWEEPRKPDLNYFLSKVLKEKEQIKSLKDQGKIGEAVSELSTAKWERAMRKAEGQKVKDDPAKLSKAIKKRQNKKKKSREKWLERENNLQKMMEKRQEKRKENLAKRKHAQKGIGKKKKGKRKPVPGF